MSGLGWQSIPSILLIAVFPCSCRKTQGVFDKCALDNLQIERPDYGYFCRAKVHDTKRPKPLAPEREEYPDATPGLPADYPKQPAKYGSRFFVFE